MKRIVCILLILAFCTSSRYAAAAASAPTGTLPSGIPCNDIETRVDAYVEENKYTTAAVSVAVFQGNEILMEKSYGYTDLENKTPNNSDAVFEWGSCTKLLTWVSVMQLVEQGKIDLNKDIREYLPYGFFKRLKYNMQITMLNLMNHNAGWQETVTDLFIKKHKDIKELGEALRLTEPEQINKPGEIVAYSNWGAALAGYIVEYVSGQSFSDYVRVNIFEPLGMEHTALYADLSDNEWVARKRSTEKCYTAACESLGTCHYYLSLYPAGNATGTLSDFAKFAQALVPKEGESSPLFQNAATLNEMLSPSLYYSDRKTARNCHGFWTDELGVPVLWHDGGTVGSSSWLAFNRETRTGIVILTNQNEEAVYNCGLLSLVFGKYHPAACTEKSANISGLYVNERSCFKGYAKLYSLFGIMQLASNTNGRYTISGTNNSFTCIGSNKYLMDMGLKQFTVFTGTAKNGGTILELPGSDYIPVNGYIFLIKIIALLLFVITTLYSLILLIIRLVGLIKHKRPHPLDTYQILTNFSVIAAFTLFIYIALRLFMTNSTLYVHIRWSLAVCTVLAFLPVIFAAQLVIQWRMLDCTIKTKAGLIINCILSLIMTANVLYWIF